MKDNDILTEKQKMILDYISDEIHKNGFAPSVREIGLAVGLKSTSSVHSQLRNLQNKGFIKKDPAKPRTIVLVDDDSDEFNVRNRGIVNIPIVGEVAAGMPIFAEQNITGYFPLIEEEMPKGDLFMLKIKGESMIEAGIYDGDMVLIRRQNTANNGDIVVALVEDSATIKTFYKENGRIRLQPENSSMEPIYTEKAYIMGKLVGLYRTYN